MTNHPLRILQLHNAGPSNLPSGELAVCESEANALKSSGHEVKQHYVYNDAVLNSGVVQKLSFAKNLIYSRDSFKQTTALLREFRPDIVHAHGVLPVLSVAVFDACRAMGIPVIQTLHNFRWLCVEGGLYRDAGYCEKCVQGNPLSGIVHRCSKNSLPISTLLTINNQRWVRSHKLFQLVDHFIAVSEFVKSKHVEGGFPAEKITVKPNGLLRVPSIVENNNLQAKREGLVFIGRLTSAKGISTLEKLIPKLDGIPLTILGDGPERLRLERCIKAAKAESTVRLLGRVDPQCVSSYLRSSQAVLVPSTCGESFGLVVIEALAVGTPVIASRIGGLSEIIHRSRGGWLVEPGSSSEILKIVKGFSDSPEPALKGERGREFVRREFDFETVIQRQVDIYRKVLRDSLVSGK